MDIIIFCGQSNMQGSTGEKDNSPAVDKALEYLYSSNELNPLSNPVGEDIGDLLYRSGGGNGSLVPAFCREYIKRTGKEVVAIHTARGDTAISEWQKGTERFSAMTDKIKAGIEKVQETGKVENIYLVFLQGEKDALEKTDTDDYLKLLVEFKNDIKKEIPLKRFGIIKVGYFAENASWLDMPKNEKRKLDKAIMKAQELAVKTDRDFCMLTRVCPKISTREKYLNKKACGPHYNNLGVEIIGKKAGRSLSKLK